jgi:hypothetical protein
MQLSSRESATRDCAAPEFELFSCYLKEDYLLLHVSICLFDLVCLFNLVLLLLLELLDFILKETVNVGLLGMSLPWRSCISFRILTRLAPLFVEFDRSKK